MYFVCSYFISHQWSFNCYVIWPQAKQYWWLKDIANCISDSSIVWEWLSCTNPASLRDLDLAQFGQVITSLGMTTSEDASWKGARITRILSWEYRENKVVIFNSVSSFKGLKHVSYCLLFSVTFYTDLIS